MFRRYRRGSPAFARNCQLSIFNYQLKGVHGRSQIAPTLGLWISLVKKVENGKFGYKSPIPLEAQRIPDSWFW